MIPNSSFKLQDRKGQILIEAIVALSILTLGYMAVLSLLNRSVGTSRVITDQNIATYLAAEGIEIVRNLIDANAMKSNDFVRGFDNPGPPGSYEISYDTLLEEDEGAGGDPDNKNPGLRIGNAGVFSTTPLRYDSASGYNYTNGTPTSFFRTVQILPPNPANRIYIASIVRWSAKGGGTSEVRLENYFFARQ